jgi:hypothetical protein
MMENVLGEVPEQGKRGALISTLCKYLHRKRSK